MGVQDASQTTLVVACPTGSSETATDLSAECAFDEPITVTVGPSTFYAEEAYESLSAIIDCKVDGTSAATCAASYVGPEYLLETDLSVLTASDFSTNTAITTSATTTVLSGTDIAFVPVTLTDDLGAAETGASAGASTASQTSTRGSGTSSGSSTATASGASRTGSATGSSATTSATTTAQSGNGAGRTDVRALAFTALGAGLLGLTALYL